MKRDIIKWKPLQPETVEAKEEFETIHITPLKNEEQEKEFFCYHSGANRCTEDCGACERCNSCECISGDSCERQINNQQREKPTPPPSQPLKEGENPNNKKEMPIHWFLYG